MNILYEILKEHSKKQSLKIAAYIGNNPTRFAVLMKLFLFGEYRVVQRAAWVVSFCSEKHPALIKPWLKKLVLNLQKPGLPKAVKRNTLRVMQFINIPKPLQGKTVDICFKFLANPTEAIAVKVFAITVLFNISKSEPYIQNELKLLIEENLVFVSYGLKSRGNKILKQINAQNGC